MEENSGQEFWITCLFRWFSLYLSGDIQSFFFDVCLSTICRSHICQVFLHGICTVLKQNAPKHNKNIRNVYRLKVYFLMKYIKKKHWKSFDNQCLYFVGVAGFEPTTPCSQSRCANRTALHPESFWIALFFKSDAKVRLFFIFAN